MNRDAGLEHSKTCMALYFVECSIQNSFRQFMQDKFIFHFLFSSFLFGFIFFFLFLFLFSSTLWFLDFALRSIELLFLGPCPPYSRINPLSAKPSFQLWYPGGQRLKVTSFSWSGVNSPPKCFSNTEPTTTIASRDEKRCNDSVQWTRSVHSSSLRLSDQHRKCHGWLFFFAVSALQPDCPAATSTSTKTAKCDTVTTSGLGNRLLKTRWFVDDEWFSLLTITRWLPCVFFFFWTMDHRTRLVPIATTIDGPSALDLANARKSSFNSSFRRTITKVLCSDWGSP